MARDRRPLLRREHVGMTDAAKAQSGISIIQQPASRAQVADRSGRLFRKYMLLIAVLVSGVLLISGLTELYFTYRENLTALSALQAEKAQAAANRIEQYVKDIEHQISLTTLPQAGASVSLLEQRRLDCLKLLRQVPAITDIVQVDHEGRELLRVSRVGLDVLNSRRDYSQRLEFKQTVTAKTWFSRVHFRRETEPYLTVGVAHGGEDQGITLVEMNLKFIWDVVSQIHVGKTGYAYVVDTEGQLIAHPDTSLVLQKSDLSSLPQIAAALAGAAHSGLTSGTGSGRGTSGTPVYTAYALIAPLNWLVFVEQPRDEAFAPLYASSIRIGLVLIAGLLLSLLASLALARRMVNPIRELQKGAAVIGKGEFGHHIEVKTGDELEALAEDLNYMAGQLRESYASLERKVEDRTRELATANRHKSEFLARMSHELRTPLNAVIGFSEVLQARFFGELNAKQAEYVKDIHTSGAHLLSLINDILDLSKIEAGRMELNVSTFDVARSIEQALTFVRDRAERARVSLEVTFSPDVGSYAGDERKFRQILLNLLSNAIKFTPAGGRVAVNASRANGALWIAVSDTGVGMSSADQDNLFQAFHRVGDRKQEGTGLGLALTRKFVELHGGSLTVFSMPNQGSTFTVALPLPS